LAELARQVFDRERMVRVIVRVRILWADESVKPGDHAELPTPMAKDLIARGLASLEQ